MTDKAAAIGPFLVHTPESCTSECGTCDACLIRLAGQSINRMLFGRWLVQEGRVTDDGPDDGTPMPTRLVRAWQDGDTR